MALSARSSPKIPMRSAISRLALSTRLSRRLRSTALSHRWSMSKPAHTSSCGHSSLSGAKARRSPHWHRALSIMSPGRKGRSSGPKPAWCKELHHNERAEYRRIATSDGSGRADRLGIDHLFYLPSRCPADRQGRPVAISHWHQLEPNQQATAVRHLPNGRRIALAHLRLAGHWRAAGPGGRHFYGRARAAAPRDDHAAGDSTVGRHSLGDLRLHRADTAGAVGSLDAGWPRA